jgi:hypothetical protein
MGTRRRLLRSVPSPSDVRSSWPSPAAALKDKDAAAAILRIPDVERVHKVAGYLDELDLGISGEITARNRDIRGVRGVLARQGLAGIRRRRRGDRFRGRVLGNDRQPALKEYRDGQTEMRTRNGGIRTLLAADGNETLLAKPVAAPSRKQNGHRCTKR